MTAPPYSLGQEAIGSSGLPNRAVTAIGSTIFALALVAAALAIAWSWRASLPDQVAAHWDFRGYPTRFTSLRSCLLEYVWLAPLSIAPFTVLTWAFGRSAMQQRWLAAATVWMGGFLAVTALGPLWHLRRQAPMAAGVTDAAMRLPVVSLMASLLLPIIPAVLTAALVRPDPSIAAVVAIQASAPRAKVRDGERVVWARRVSGGGGRIVPAVITGGWLVAALLLRLWWPLILAVLFALIMLVMWEYSVRVDEGGITVQFWLGWPRIRVSANEIERTSVIEVDPMADFGGWGWRIGAFGKGAGRTGVVTRRGEALLIEYTGGRGLIVTTDNANDAAALLNTAAENARQTNLAS